MFAIFLLPNGTFLFELVIFILVLGVVAKFILPPIQGALDARATMIRESQRALDEGQAEADQLGEESARVLERARAEARLLLEEASRSVEEAREEARARAAVEHDAVVSAAQQTLAQERERVRAEAIARLEAIVITAASQVIGAEIDPTPHHEIIAAAIREANAKVGV